MSAGGKAKKIVWSINKTKDAVNSYTDVPKSEKSPKVSVCRI